MTNTQTPSVQGIAPLFYCQGKPVHKGDELHISPRYHAQAGPKAKAEFPAHGDNVRLRSDNGAVPMVPISELSWGPHPDVVDTEAICKALDCYPRSVSHRDLDVWRAALETQNPRDTEFGREAEKLADEYIELNRKYTELLEAQKAQEPVKLRSVLPKGFLSDVLTAAGLVRHGKQCKGLADRLGEAYSQIVSGATLLYLHQHPPAAPALVPLTEREIVKCIADAGCIGTVKMSFESGPYDIDRPSLNATKLVEAVTASLARINGLTAGTDSGYGGAKG